METGDKACDHKQHYMQGLGVCRTRGIGYCWQYRINLRYVTHIECSATAVERKVLSGYKSFVELFIQIKRKDLQQ